MSKISRAFSRVRRAAEVLLDDPPPFQFEPSDEYMPGPAKAPQQVFIEPEVVTRYEPESELEVLRRKCAEYFGVIERIERERNGWIDMYRIQASEHLTAQGMLERELIATRQVAARAIRMLNSVRKEHDLEPIKDKTGLVGYEDEPVGLVERYAARMKELHNQMPKPIDGEAERERIRAAG